MQEMRYPFRGALLSALVTLPQLGGCSTVEVRNAAPTLQVAAGAPLVIFVIRRRWHTDIGFDVADLHAPVSGLRGRLPEAHYLLFGFGDRHYLMNHRGNAGEMSGAVWPGPGLVLVTALAATPEQAFGAAGVIRLTLNATQAAALEHFIWNTLAANGGTASELAPGPYAGSFYYASTLRYSGLHTCNTWTAEALRAAGLPVHSVGVELAGQVWRQAQRIDRQQHAAGQLIPSRP